MTYITYIEMIPEHSGFTTIFTITVSSSHTHGVVYSIQHINVIEFVSDLRQVCGVLWVLWFPQPIKLTDKI